MGWLCLNLPIVLKGKFHIPLSVSVTVAYPSQMIPSRTPTSRTYSSPTTNKKDAESNKLAICSPTKNFYTGAQLEYYRLTLTDSERTRTEHICKGHQRHGHSKLAHTSQRDQIPTTHKWMHNPHTPIEILFEMPLKDSLHWRSLLIFLLVSFPINNIISLIKPKSKFSPLYVYFFVTSFFFRLLNVEISTLCMGERARAQRSFKPPRIF